VCGVLKQWRELKARFASSIVNWRDRRWEELENHPEELYKRLRRESAHERNLIIFMARLTPRDENSNPMEHYSAMSYDPAVVQVCDTWDRDLQCIRLAEGPLEPDDEDVAKSIALLLTSEHLDRHKNDIVHKIGQLLCAKGGRWLMMLVACRAQYISDPTWRVKWEAYTTALRESAGGNVDVVADAGSIIRELEYAWNGICGWKRVVAAIAAAAARRATETTCTECGRAPDDEAPTLVCPSCEYQMSGYNEQFLARRAVEDGEWSAPCDGCDHETFIFESQSVCARCGRLRMDVNDQLMSRFAELEGQPPRAGHRIGKASPIKVEAVCPSCERRSWIYKNVLDQKQGAVVCGASSSPFRIPASGGAV
jgi:hypothetical protein